MVDIIGFDKEGRVTILNMEKPIDMSSQKAMRNTSPFIESLNIKKNMLPVLVPEKGQGAALYDKAAVYVTIKQYGPKQRF